MLTEDQKYPPLLRYVLFALAISLTLFGLVQAKELLYPLAFAVLLSYLLFPFTNFLEKRRIHRIPAILITLILALVVLGGILFFISEQIQLLLKDFPVLKRQALVNIRVIQKELQTIVDFANIQVEDFFKPRVNMFFNNAGDLFNALFTATTGTAFKIALMPVYVFLFLYYRTKFAYFILKIVPVRKKERTVQVLREISKVSAQYMGGVFIVVICMFILNSVGLSLIGIEHAVTLGLLSAFFSFIPYFGTLLGSIIPLAFAFFTGDFPVDPLKVAGLYLFLNFIENDFLTPNIVGNNVNISPFFIILGLIIGAMIWGVPGMLVVVPVLAVIRIVFQHIEKLRPYAFLLSTSGTRKYELSVKKIRNWLKKKDYDR